MSIIYLATADLATIHDGNLLAVDTIAHPGTDHADVDHTVYSAPIGETPDEDAWDAQLAAAGFARTGDWRDHGGYHTADVEFANQPPPDESHAAAALAALARLDPVHTARRTPVLSRGVVDLLAAHRDAAIYKVSRGGWGPAAAALGLSQASVNRSVTRHRDRIGAAA